MRNFCIIELGLLLVLERIEYFSTYTVVCEEYEREFHVTIPYDESMVDDVLGEIFEINNEQIIDYEEDFN